jgi:hypothetical protein
MTSRARHTFTIWPSVPISVQVTVPQSALASEKNVNTKREEYTEERIVTLAPGPGTQRKLEEEGRTSLSLGVRDRDRYISTVAVTLRNMAAVPARAEFAGAAAQPAPGAQLRQS